LEGCSRDPKKLAEARLIVDEDSVSSIVGDILDKVDDEFDHRPTFFNEQFRVQLLQLATLLIRCLPDDLVKHRKELIKFGWNHLKREDRASKQFAFVNVCYFLEAYQAPEKDYFASLRRAPSCVSTGCEGVGQDCALTALVPALPKRLPRGDHKYPIWIDTQRKFWSRKVTPCRT
jgi:transformation/transcription domain-associated protein